MATWKVIVVTAYNTKLVRKEDVPKSYEDLLNPRWKGKMVLDTQDADWFHTMLDYLGEEKGLTFMKRLAQLAPEMRTGHTLESQLLAAGEYSMSPILYGYRVAQMMTEGAPVDFTMIDPVITKPRLSALARQAPHPPSPVGMICSPETRAAMSNSGMPTMVDQNISWLALSRLRPSASARK